MRTFLIGLFLLILIAMLSVTTWASLQVPIWQAWDDITDPWTIATLFDAYCGFITFFCWLAWRERNNLVRVAWFAAIMLLGNIAMSIYVLLQLFAMRQDDSLAVLFDRKELKPQGAAA